MRDRSSLTLVGLDIEGEWNLPLLKNAAELSHASLKLVNQRNIPAQSCGTSVPTTPNLIASVEDLRTEFDCLLACETGKISRSIYGFPAPRGRVALLVGNELDGIPREDLTKVDQVLSIPLQQSQMSSVNVAVAAAVSLYALSHDLARKGIKPSRMKQSNIDVLIYGAEDPSELGSLFRSTWAFGWKRAFLDDRAGIWFVKDRQTILAGRAAARREKNLLAILPVDKLSIGSYGAVVVCSDEGSGTPLSRFRVPRGERLLIAFGRGEPPVTNVGTAIQEVFVDHLSRQVQPSYRHSGSILLSYISECSRSTSRHG